MNVKYDRNLNNSVEMIFHAEAKRFPTSKEVTLSCVLRMFTIVYKRAQYLSIFKATRTQLNHPDILCLRSILILN